MCSSDLFLPGTEAHILSDRHNNRIGDVILTRRNLAFERLAVRALEMPQRVRSDATNAGVAVFLRDDIFFAFRLNVGQLQFLAEDLRQFLQGDINLDDMLPGSDPASP